jgi:multidrug efflux pump subunit AcrA (membrane-fusion protein)
LDALYQTSEARGDFAARCEALAARARANAQAFLPTSALWEVAPAAVSARAAEPAAAGAGELPCLLVVKTALQDAAEQLLRASDVEGAPYEVSSAVAEAVAKVELARSQLAFASAAAGAQLAGAHAATAELRGALEEALEDAREAEAQLSGERNRANALEAHLRNVLSSTR